MTKIINEKSHDVPTSRFSSLGMNYDSQQGRLAPIKKKNPAWIIPSQFFLSNPSQFQSFFVFLQTFFQRFKFFLSLSLPVWTFSVVPISLQFYYSKIQIFLLLSDSFLLFFPQQSYLFKPSINCQVPLFLLLLLLVSFHRFTFLSFSNISWTFRCFPR